jgi:hypothetical protein
MGDDGYVLGVFIGTGYQSHGLISTSDGSETPVPLKICEYILKQEGEVQRLINKIDDLEFQLEEAQNKEGSGHE